MTSHLLSFLEYCNNFKAVSIYPYSLLTSYFLSQLLPYNSSKHCYKISLSLSFRESSQASHCLQNKSNTIIFAYNALHSMLPPYISILITFLSVCLSLCSSLSLSVIFPVLPYYSGLSGMFRSSHGCMGISERRPSRQQTLWVQEVESLPQDLLQTQESG